MKKTSSSRPQNAVICFLAMLVLILTGVPVARGAITLYSDNFESYPIQNPAPNPLTNGPAGGQWFYVDPVPPLTAGEHQILKASSAGAGIYSRVWASATNNARLTNAISVSSLPAGSGPYTFRLSFVVAADTLTTTRNITFNYAISSTASDLSFVSGHNLDNSQTFAGLSGTGLATAGTIGKSNNRRFEFVFTSSAITTADKIIFDITRVTNNAGGVLNMFLDDVRLGVDDANGPQVQSLTPVLTLEHVKVNFSEPVDPASATNIANYTLLGGTNSVLTAVLLTPSVVELFTSDQAPNTTYTLQISNVLGESAISMVSTQLDFTSPALTISPVRYDAGTTVTQPSGPLDPASSAAGNWSTNAFSNPGLSVGAVTNDNSTGFNAWNVTDSTTLSGTPNYALLISQAASLNQGLSNGWRIVIRSRLVDNFGSTASDQVILMYNPGIRYGLFWGVDINGNYFVNAVGALTYPVTSDAFSYHTNMMIFDPATQAVACYFDGRLLVESYTGQALAGSGITFGAASSAGKGGMNYNLVQLDVVGATQPVVLQNPPSTTNGVGQKVTFAPVFSQYVNAFQWFSNNVLIASATGSNYTTGFIDSSYNGAQYKCRALSNLGNVDTTPATLTVTTDVTPPFIVTAHPSLLRDRITIVYSEPVLETYATNIANYTWVNSGVTNLSGRLLDPLTVELRAGPFLSGTNYTVRVNNVRDTSNLVIATNSPASVVFSTLSPLAHYDAGDITNAPSGPPDPVSPAGGSWIASIANDPNISTNAVVNDLGLNAWQVRDASVVQGDFGYYNLQIATNLQDNALHSGWVLSIRSRIAENFGTAAGVFAFFGDYHSDRSGFAFLPDVNNNIVASVTITGGFSNVTLTSDGSALNAYHLYQAVYNPSTSQISYYYDGSFIAANALSVTAGSPGVVWGTLGSATEGTMNFNLVDLSSADAPIVASASAAPTPKFPIMACWMWLRSWAIQPLGQPLPPI